jgi:hypothetical protein
MRRGLRMVAGAALSVLAVTACGGGSDPNAAPTSAPTFKVPDSLCPSDYGVGLTITTDSPAEVDYLDKIVACTSSAGTASYLKNTSTAVWKLRLTRGAPETVRWWDEGLKARAFRNLFPTDVLLVPEAVMTVGLPPDSLAWDIDLPLSISWEGHDLLAAKVASLGDAALIAALKQQSLAGRAIAQCALTVEKYAESVQGLTETDMTDVLLRGLGVGIATNKCTSTAAQVEVRDPTTRRGIALTTSLEDLSRQTVLLSELESRLGYAKRGARVLTLGISFLRK